MFSGDDLAMLFDTSGGDVHDSKKHRTVSILISSGILRNVIASSRACGIKHESCTHLFAV